jgi:hypothetical protein
MDGRGRILLVDRAIAPDYAEAVGLNWSEQLPFLRKI